MASCINYCRAIIVRLLFSLHGAVMVISCVMITQEHYYWGLFASLGALLVETLITLLFNGGHEYKWFSPCIFLYTLSVVPPVWVKELHFHIKLAANLTASKEENKSAFKLIPDIKGNNSMSKGNYTEQLGEEEDNIEATEMIKSIFGVCFAPVIYAGFFG